MRQKFHPRRPSEPQVTPPGSPREQIVPQRECPQHAALHPVQNSGDMLGAENRGGGSEFRDGSAGDGGRGELPGVADKDSEDVENSPDAPWDGAGFCGGWGGWRCSGHRDGG